MILGNVGVSPNYTTIQTKNIVRLLFSPLISHFSVINLGNPFDNYFYYV
jgi:hypothetical protein